MSPLFNFLKDSGGWGVASVVAAFLFFGISLWERAHDKTVSAFVFLCLSVPLFWIGSLVAWNKKRKEVARLYKPADCPIVRICDWGSMNNNQPPFGFFLQNYGLAAAHEVSLAQFQLGTYAVMSQILAAIRGNSVVAHLPVWITPVRDQLANTKWNLLGAFSIASEEKDAAYYSNNPHGVPNYSVTVTLTYRDHRDLWYRTTQQIDYVPAAREFQFGAIKHEYIGPRQSSSR
jgi:hypothetical protein